MPFVPLYMKHRVNPVASNIVCSLAYLVPSSPHPRIYPVIPSEHHRMGRPQIDKHVTFKTKQYDVLEGVC